MMYRGGDPCDAHVFATAVGACSDCGSRVCDGCQAFSGVARRCPGCAHQVRRRQSSRENAARVVLFLVSMLASVSLGRARACQ